jgi:hypothetical protein
MIISSQRAYSAVTRFRARLAQTCRSPSLWIATPLRVVGAELQITFELPDLAKTYRF